MMRAHLEFVFKSKALWFEGCFPNQMLSQRDGGCDTDASVLLLRQWPWGQRGPEQECEAQWSCRLRTLWKSAIKEDVEGNAASGPYINRHMSS